MTTNRFDESQVPSLNGAVALITGANSGIGFENARALATAGAAVVLACRNESAGAAAAARIEAMHPGSRPAVYGLDLTSLDSVRAFAARFKNDHGRLDLLINNAGVMVPPLTRTREGFELQMGVNHLGHFLLTALLFPLVRQTPRSRIVTVASQAHRMGKIDFDDLNWEHRQYRRGAAYGASKLANLLFAFELHRRLQAAGCAVLSVASHPGWTATSLMRHVNPIAVIGRVMAMKPAQGALPTLYAATDPSVQSGDYIGPGGLFEMWGFPARTAGSDAANDRETATRLWAVSQALTNTTFDLTAP
jgi:NAD(P)-dependent dehydrogenase (short-subunit alcohol dehydrogenase family)